MAIDELLNKNKTVVSTGLAVWGNYTGAFKYSGILQTIVYNLPSKNSRMQTLECKQ